MDPNNTPTPNNNLPPTDQPTPPAAQAPQTPLPPPLAPSQTIAPSFMQPAPAAASHVDEKSSKNKKLLLIILVVLLLAGGGAAAYFMTKDKTGNSASKSAATNSAQEKESTNDSNTAIPGQQVDEKDSERQNDIKALHGQLEAYYAQNGRYPTLANMNDAAFRTANLKGLDDAALKDPEGSDAVLVAAPAPKAYAYAASFQDGKECNNGTGNSGVDCVRYTLTATLSDGSPYKKIDLGQVADQ